VSRAADCQLSPQLPECFFIQQTSGRNKSFIDDSKESKDMGLNSAGGAAMSYSEALDFTQRNLELGNSGKNNNSSSY
jgi:hypothetical protein